MMPVIRLNDATFADLRSIATWLGTETPSKTVDEIVRRTMKELDLERDEDVDTVSKGSGPAVIEFEKAPGLSFTKPVSASVNDNEIKNPKWTTILASAIEAVKGKGLSGDQLVGELQIPARTGAYFDEGFKHHPDLGFSVQGQSAQDAWKEIDRLASKWHVPVMVKFRWRENEKAQHPGRTGVLRSGSA